SRLSQINLAIDEIEKWSRNFISTPTFVHGDLWLNNGLFDGENNLVGVIDWEWADENGFALYDALHCLLISTAAYSGEGVAAVLRRVWRGSPNDECLSHCMSDIKRRA